MCILCLHQHAKQADEGAFVCLAAEVYWCLLRLWWGGWRWTLSGFQGLHRESGPACDLWALLKHSTVIHSCKYKKSNFRIKTQYFTGIIWYISNAKSFIHSTGCPSILKLFSLFSPYLSELLRPLHLHPQLIPQVSWPAAPEEAQNKTGPQRRSNVFCCSSRTLEWTPQSNFKILPKIHLFALAFPSNSLQCALVLYLGWTIQSVFFWVYVLFISIYLLLFLYFIVYFVFSPLF